MCARLPDESATNVASQQGVYGRGSDGRLMSELGSVKRDGCIGGCIDGYKWEKERLEMGEGLSVELGDYLSKKDVGLTNGVDGFTEAFGYFLFDASSSQSSSWRVGSSSDGSRDENIYLLFNFKFPK